VRRIKHLQKFLAIAGIGAAFLVGCDRDEQIQSYQTPKEKVSGDQGLVAMFSGMGGANAQASVGDIHWTLPEGWKQVAVPDDPQAMFRPDAQFAVDANNPQLLMSISHLGDAPGARSVLQNVNRWEGQEQLPPSTEADLPKVTSSIQVGDVQGTLVDLNGKDRRLLGAIVPHANHTWYFKLAGPADQVTPHKEQFEQFVHSIKFDSSEPAPTVAQQEPTPTPAPSISSPAPAGVTWQVPAGWVEQPLTPMVLGKFLAGTATVKVSKLVANNFGSLKGNLDRWRGEVGVGPVDPSVQDVPEVQIGSRNWKEYDFSGPGVNGAGHSRVIVAQTQQGNDVYFFKISGPADAVAQQKPAFDQFVASVKVGS
jgi:hypothetical protein